MTLASIVAIPVAQRKSRAKALPIIGAGAVSPCGHLKARFTECGTFERTCKHSVGKRLCGRSYAVTVRPAQLFENKYTAEWKP